MCAAEFILLSESVPVAIFVRGRASEASQDSQSGQSVRTVVYPGAGGGAHVVVHMWWCTWVLVHY